MILSHLQHNLKSSDTNVQKELKYETDQSDILFQAYKIDLETEQELKELLINQTQLLKLKLIISQDYNLHDILRMCKQLSLYNQISQLQFIVYENQVNLDCLQILCKNIKNFNNLQIFKINLQQKQIKENQFDDQKTLKQINQLTDLSSSIGQNQIPQHIINCIAGGIKQLDQLLSLSLIISQNQINQEGAIQLGISLKNLINLKQFSLQIESDNNLNSEGAQGIGEGIQCLINLEELQISIGKNNIKQTGVNVLLNSLKYLENLLSLSLTFDQNDIGVYGFNQFEQNIVCYNKLKSLSINIRDNTIDSKLIQYLSGGIKNMQLLSSLSISIASDFNFKFDIIYQFLITIQYDIKLLKDFKFQIDLQYKIGLNQTLLIQEIFRNLQNIEILNLNIPTHFVILPYKEIIKSKYQINQYSQEIVNIKNLINLYQSIGNDPEDLKQLPENIRILSNKLQQNQGKYDDVNKILYELTDIYVLKFKLSESFFNKFGIVIQSFQLLTNLVELNLTISFKIKDDIGIKYLQNLQILKISFEKYSKFYFYHYELVNLVHLSINIKTAFSIINLGNCLRHHKKLQIFELEIHPWYNTYYKKNQLIFESLEYLTSLKQLNLSTNNCKLNFADSMQLGQSLEQLNLSINNCNLNFANSMQFGQSLKQLNLSINNCNLNFANSMQLGQSLKKLSQIEKFSISIYNCTKNSICAKALSDGISQLTQLRNLKIDFETEIIESKLDLQDMFKNISNLNNLSSVSITFNFSLEENEVIAITTCLENLPNLIQLEFIDNIYKYYSDSDSFINNKSAIEIGNSFKKLKNLKELNLVLNDNKIQWDGWISLAKGIASLVQLNTLKLNIYNCDVQFAKILGDNIHLLTNLIILQYEFRFNDNFSGQYLSKQLQHQISLTDLSFALTENSITDQGMVKIGQVLKNLQNLSRLTILIYSNQIKPEGFIGLSEGLKHLINLKYLSLYIQTGNYIDEIGKEEIGLSLENLQNLETLQLRFEKFCFNSNLKQLFMNLSNLVNLKNISLTIYDNTQPENHQLLYQQLKNIKSLENIEIDFIGEENYIYLSLLQFLPKLNKFKIDESPIKIDFKTQNNLIDRFLDDKQITQLSFNLSYPTTLLRGIDLAFSNFEYVQKLDFVFDHNIKAQIVKNIFNGVKHLKLLRHLSFITNQYNYDNDVFENTVNGIQSISTLNINSLVLSSQNALKDIDFQRLVFQGIAHFKNLFYLDLKCYYESQRLQNRNKYDIISNQAFKRLIKYQ